MGMGDRVRESCCIKGDESMPNIIYISATTELYEAAVEVVEKAKQKGRISCLSKEIFELARAIEKAEGKVEDGKGN